jgi:translation initiation factor 3 subunit C
LKRAKRSSSESSDDRQKKPVKKIEKVKIAKDDDEEFITVGDRQQAASDAKELALLQQITADNLYAKLQETLEARGRKATDKAGQVRVFRRMLQVGQNEYQNVKVLLALIPALFDYNPSNYTHLSVDTWKEYVHLTRD